jgi:hypothetical protein
VSRRLNKEDFIERSIKKHGIKYDYSLVEYVNCRTKIEIICKIHGKFYQTPSAHLRGDGCSKCGGNNNKTTNEFIELSKLIHNDKYDYSLVNYINAITKVIIICEVHGKFYQTPPNHIHGNGCPKCCKNIKMNTEDFIKKSNLVHYDKYDYSLTKYIGAKIKVKIVCREHEIFEQKPYHHLSGRGCPKCGIKESKGNKEISIFLDKNKINYSKEYEFENCKNISCLPFDFYLPDYNMCIEYDGLQHYEPVEYFGGLISYNKIVINDNIKNKFCDENNIKLIRIRYNEIIVNKLVNIIK